MQGEPHICTSKLASVFHHLPSVGPKQFCELVHLGYTCKAICPSVIHKDILEHFFWHLNFPIFSVQFSKPTLSANQMKFQPTFKVWIKLLRLVLSEIWCFQKIILESFYRSFQDYFLEQDDSDKAKAQYALMYVSQRPLLSLKI